MGILIADTVQVDTIENEAGTFEHARLVQIQATSTGAVSTTTTTIPEDDTIPQNSEGGELLTQAITPQHADNKLFITAIAQMKPSTGRNLGLAIFQDSTANALATNWSDDQGTQTSQVVLTHVMSAGTTSATTFKLRGGADSAATVTINGSGGSRLMGGVFATSLTIMEFRA